MDEEAPRLLRAKVEDWATQGMDSGMTLDSAVKAIMLQLSPQETQHLAEARVREIITEID